MIELKRLSGFAYILVYFKLRKARYNLDQVPDEDEIERYVCAKYDLEILALAKKKKLCLFREICDLETSAHFHLPAQYRVSERRDLPGLKQGFKLWRKRMAHFPKQKRQIKQRYYEEQFNYPYTSAVYQVLQRREERKQLARIN